jgi:hypothetical protein
MIEKMAGTVAQLVERSTNDPKWPKRFMNQALANVIKHFTAVIYE